MSITWLGIQGELREQPELKIENRDSVCKCFKYQRARGDPPADDVGREAARLGPISRNTGILVFRHQVAEALKRQLRKSNW